MASGAKEGIPEGGGEGDREGGPVEEVEEETPDLWKVPEVMRDWSTWKGKGKGGGREGSSRR